MTKAKVGTAGPAAEMQILKLDFQSVGVYVVGTSPIICNRMSKKTWEILENGGEGKKKGRYTTIKHDALAEYRESPYTLDGGPTRLGALAVWFKKSMMTAALRMPRIHKTEIGQLVRVEGERIPLYGIPQLFMAVTRSKDIDHTPDVRTRAIIPEWAVLLDIRFLKGRLNTKSIGDLLASAGVVSGVGDWRTEKGSANYGSFRLADANDKELKKILATGGRAAQIKALNVPTFYDDETEELFLQHRAYAEERGFKVVA